MGFLKRIVGGLSGADAHVGHQWDMVCSLILKTCPKGDAGWCLVSLAKGWFEALIYDGPDGKSLLRVAPKTIDAQAIITCLCVQTILYYRYADLFNRSAIVPIMIYSGRVFPDLDVSFLERFDAYDPPVLYGETMREYAMAVGLRCSDDANPPWDFTAAFTFRAMCEEMLRNDVEALLNVYLNEKGGT